MSRSGGRDRVGVLVVGQTPPPYHGQAIGIESFVTGSYADIDITHVRMNFSAEIGDVGRFQIKKLFHLVAVVARVLWKRVTTKAEVLYYPPAGPDMVPVLRDIAVLLTVRWAFRRTVFHFHAAGLADVYERLPRVVRAAFRRAYFRPDLAILPAPRNPSDGTFVGALREVVVPYGIPDTTAVKQHATSVERPVILFVGAVRESKGVLDLLEAARALKERGLPCEVQLMGGFADSEFERRAVDRVRALGIEDDVVFLGVRTASEKDETFSRADVFCFPTRYEAETFGIVVIEAMRAGLPVVATEWRGIPWLVEEGETGFLVPVHDVGALADRLAQLMKEPTERARMGRQARAAYLDRFTEEHFRRAMEAAITQLVPSRESTPRP